jgi:hypothetical protein
MPPVPGRFRYLLYKDVNRHAKLRGPGALAAHPLHLLPKYLGFSGVENSAQPLRP